MKRTLPLTVLVLALGAVPAAAQPPTWGQHDPMRVEQLVRPHYALSMSRAKRAITVSWSGGTRFARCWRLSSYAIRCDDWNHVDGWWIGGIDTAFVVRHHVKVVTGPGSLTRSPTG